MQRNVLNNQTVITSTKTLALPESNYFRMFHCSLTCLILLELQKNYQIFVKKLAYHNQL